MAKISLKLDSSRKPDTFDKRKNNQISTHLDTKPKEEKNETEFYGIQMQFLNGEQGKDPSKTVESNGTARNKTEESKPHYLSCVNSHEGSHNTKVEIYVKSGGGGPQNDSTSRGQLVFLETIASGGLQDESTSTRECSDWHKSEFSKPRFSEKLANASVETLKARLLEARLEGQQARLKASRGYSVGGARQG